VEQAVALVGNNGLTSKYLRERRYRDAVSARVRTPQGHFVVAAAGGVRARLRPIVYLTYRFYMD
jgi:hypothetical protein